MTEIQNNQRTGSVETAMTRGAEYERAGRTPTHAKIVPVLAGIIGAAALIAFISNVTFPFLRSKAFNYGMGTLSGVALVGAPAYYLLFSGMQADKKLKLRPGLVEARDGLAAFLKYFESDDSWAQKAFKTLAKTTKERIDLLLEPKPLKAVPAPKARAPKLGQISIADIGGTDFPLSLDLDFATIGRTTLAESAADESPTGI